ncbi:UNVERIFIED_CONTAM: hypothetical protein GTU68_023808 [Idotea baltica]|nr:hypothetical protein [Idotea baltica]
MPVLSETAEKFEQSALLEEGRKVRVPTKAELAAISEPWRRFLLAHAGTDELSHFRDVGVEGEGVATFQRATLEFNDFSWLIPAFVLTELKEAFIIGFALFIPFVAVDLIVTNLLVGLGMMMVSPNTIALPLKILLFVSCDGWLKLSSSLLSGYR